MLQASPSQWIASVRCRKPSTLWKPTAQQSLAELQLTPDRRFSAARSVFGEATRSQVAPFQWSTSVWYTPVSWKPTAQQSLSDTQVTSVRKLLPPATLGDSTRLQSTPSQRSVSVCQPVAPSE